MIDVAFTLQADRTFLELVAEPVLPLVDRFEVTPETLWTVDRGAPDRFVPNGYFESFLTLGRSHGKRFAAHGVGWSPGSAAPERDGRRVRWLDAMALTHAEFAFDWWTDHLGVTDLDGENLMLPLALPFTDAMAAHIRDGLVAMADVVPAVGLENSAFYYALGDPLDEPAFLADALADPRAHLLLDLHNLVVNAENHGFDADAWLARAPLEKVIEVHVSGGCDSDPAWLPGGRTMRLDSHDHAVPDEVWRRLAEVVPRCPNLRAVTLERMEGTVGPEDVAPLMDEVRRLREVVA